MVPDNSLLYTTHDLNIIIWLVYLLTIAANIQLLQKHVASEIVYRYTKTTLKKEKTLSLKTEFKMKKFFKWALKIIKLHLPYIFKTKEPINDEAGYKPSMNLLKNEKEQNPLTPVIKDVPGTPFKLVNPGNGNLYSLVWGNNILCAQQFTSVSDALKWIESNFWELNTTVSSIIYNHFNNQKS